MSQQPNGGEENKNIAEIHLRFNKSTGELNYSANNVEQIEALGMLSFAQGLVQRVQPASQQRPSIVVPHGLIARS